MKQKSKGNLEGYWPASQAYIFGTITLLVGIGVGYLLHSSGRETLNTPTSTTTSSTLGNTMPAVDTASVQPLLAQLQSRPNDPELLAQIGNQYYDMRNYKQAIDYYRRALQSHPENVGVRTDMATAMWYLGDADGALQNFNTSLKYQPNHAQTLFNMGIVKSQGKHDYKGAIEAWQKLLSTNPDYPERQRVVELLQQARMGQ